MDEVISRIKNYVTLIYSGIANDELLDFTVQDVVDRALVYMNRQDLVSQYEEDLTHSSTSDPDYVDPADYVLPIPKEVERALAKSVVQVYRNTVNEANDDSTVTRDVKSLSDNGQSITYADSVRSYVTGADDESLLSGCTKLLDTYKLASVISNGQEYVKPYWTVQNRD